MLPAYTATSPTADFGVLDNNSRVEAPSLPHQAVQVEANALALGVQFLWSDPVTSDPFPTSPTTVLMVIDVSDPDAPKVASTRIAPESTPWGRLFVRGSDLYVTEREPVSGGDSDIPRFRYWLDRIDLSDRTHPRVASRVNVSGPFIESAPDSDPSLLYVNGRRWITRSGSQGETLHLVISSVDVLRLEGDRAELLGFVDLDGPPGPLFFTGGGALLSVGETRAVPGAPFGETYLSPVVQQVDVSDPSHPVVRSIDGPQESRRWLFALAGDLALFTSGWGGTTGVDVYRLSPGGPPRFEQFLRGSITEFSRQSGDLYVASGQWGVHTLRIGAAN